MRVGGVYVRVRSMDVGGSTSSGRVFRGMADTACARIDMSQLRDVRLAKKPFSMLATALYLCCIVNSSSPDILLHINVEFRCLYKCIPGSPH
jgi:hypothetical protein